MTALLAKRRVPGPLCLPVSTLPGTPAIFGGGDVSDYRTCAFLSLSTYQALTCFHPESAPLITVLLIVTEHRSVVVTWRRSQQCLRGVGTGKVTGQLLLVWNRALKVQGVLASWWHVGASPPQGEANNTLFLWHQAECGSRPPALGSLHHRGPSTQASGSIYPLTLHCFPPFRFLEKGFFRRGSRTHRQLSIASSHDSYCPTVLEGLHCGPGVSFHSCLQQTIVWGRWEDAVKLGSDESGGSNKVEITHSLEQHGRLSGGGDTWAGIRI